MRFLTFFNADNEIQLGLKNKHGVIDVARASEALDIHVPRNPYLFFVRGKDVLPNCVKLLQAAQDIEVADWLLQEDDLELGPCVLEPGKILCVGLNYRKHAAEVGMAEPTEPILFGKFGNALAAHGDEIPLYPGFEHVDYEAELVAVIGKTARFVSEENALDYVLGYCNGNDISERKLQMTSSQWLLGKTPDKFLPIGPYLVTADDVDDPQDLQVRCWLNDELRQDSNTSDMIFSVAQVIAYASQYMTLQPGDIIATGTPEGVISGLEDRVWMKEGDKVTVQIGKLGRLVNTMKEI